MIDFDLQAGVQAARDAVQTGRILAMRDVPVTECVYLDDKGFRCAIGAMLSRTQLNDLKRRQYNNDTGVETAFNELSIGTTICQMMLLTRLQALHDKWATKNAWIIPTHLFGDERLDNLPEDQSRFITRENFVAALDAVDDYIAGKLQLRFN